MRVVGHGGLNLRMPKPVLPRLERSADFIHHRGIHVPECIVPAPFDSHRLQLLIDLELLEDGVEYSIAEIVHAQGGSFL